MFFLGNQLGNQCLSEGAKPKSGQGNSSQLWYHGNDAVLGRYHFHDTTVCTNIMEMLPDSYKEQNLQNCVIMGLLCIKHAGSSLPILLV